SRGGTAASMSVNRETAPIEAAPSASHDGRWSLPVGKVVRRARHDDPSQEYFVYIPHSAGVGAPALVAVHGISRHARELGKLFAASCEKDWVGLGAPPFSKRASADYQRLGRTGRGPRADLALHSILEEVAWLTGASTARFYLFGFSGGAQFAHRYLMAHPHRVAGAVIASAGWYTYPDAR